MISWVKHYATLSVRQLPLLWFVLTISPNLNPVRSGWVLLVVYGLLYGAVSGFGISFDLQYAAKQKKSSRSSGVWFVAAGLYCLAAIFSAANVNVLFFTLITLYGIIALGLEIFHHENSLVSIVGKALLEGVFSLFILYVGINDTDLPYTLRLTVLIPGAIVTTLLIAIDLVKYNASSSQNLTTSLLLFLFSIAATVFYFNLYLSIDYVWPVLFFLVILVMNILLSHWDVSKFQFVSKRRLVFWIYVLLLNGCFFYVFTAHTHILQLL